MYSCSGKQWHCLVKWKRHTFEPTIPKLGIYPKKWLHMYKGTSTKSIITALLVEKELKILQMSISRRLDEYTAIHSYNIMHTAWDKMSHGYSHINHWNIVFGEKKVSCRTIHMVWFHLFKVSKHSEVNNILFKDSNVTDSWRKAWEW